MKSNVSNLPQYVVQYLEKFEYNKKYFPFRTINKTYKIIIVIPAISERENIRNLLNNLRNVINNKISVLIIIVVNNKQSTNNSIKLQNYKTIELLKSIEKINNIDINFIDASSPGNELPEKDGGVGLARKIGMDLALNYFDYSNNTLLVCLDADCEVSKNYLEVLENYANIGIKAGYVPFEHRFTDNEEENFAIICYDIFLHYYVAMLKYALSPYAFHTIGSTMVCSADAYCKIQGMNKRLAAEDFYFMEKLSKLYEIKILKEAKVYPLGRSSWRVPFGTGQRVARYLAKIQNEYVLYDPNIFLILKSWNEIYFNNNTLLAEEYLLKAEKISIHLKNFLLDNNFEKEWQKILNSSKSETQIQKQKKYWFDGFRTLKLVHYLRDIEYPNVSMHFALNVFVKLINADTYNNFSTKQEQLEYLKTLKNYIECE